MKIYTVCWFDRRIDPYIVPHTTLESATMTLEDCMGWREYEYLDSDIPEDEQFGEDGAGWRDYIYTFPAVRYITAEMEDGPKGYILEHEVGLVSEGLPSK